MTMPKAGELLSIPLWVSLYIDATHPSVFVSQYEVGSDDKFLAIGESTVTVRVPDDFSPVSAATAAIERAKAEALEQFQKTVAQLNQRLSELQALEA